jgi:hypothetical protein
MCLKSMYVYKLVKTFGDKKKKIESCWDKNTATNNSWLCVDIRIDSL